MKLIILAAWKWTRLKPFTNTTQKSLIKIFWKTIIEYNLENFYNSVDEIIIVVKYLKEKIVEYLWNNYKWTKITYHIQREKKWTAAALFWIKTNSDVFIIYWDSIFEKKDLDKIIKLKWYGVLVKEVKTPEKYWIFKIDKTNKILEVVEKPKKFIGNLANLWWFKLNSKIFEYIKEIKISQRLEYELTCAISKFAKQNILKAIKIEWEFIDVWSPWDILSANKYFTDNIKKSSIKWFLENNVQIKWNVIIEKWTILKSWTYIEWNVYIWKNSSIWPNIYIRNNTVIWNNCKIWNAVEIKNSSIWDNTNIAHLSYLWDSIIWNNVNIWWWFISANLKHDWSNIKVMIKWQLIDSWLRKLWCIIWDNVKTWINTSTYPWRIIENNTFTMPSEIIK